MELKPKIPNNKLPLLPPDRDAIETKAILRQESKAAVALAELKGLAHTLPNQNILINAIVLKEAKASSEIENVITTHDSLYKALTAKSFKPDSATKEVLHYREALFTGSKFIRDKGFLSTNGIIQVQNILEENTAGLRQLPGTTLKNDATGEVIYTPPDDKDAISNLMTNLEKFLNIDEDDDVSPLIKLAVQHYQFESIHPFYDGNGRAGRIVNVLYLMLKGLLDSPILYLSGFIIQNKGEYYRLLRNVTFKAVWEPWILYILKGIEQTATDTIKQVNSINSLLNETINIVKGKTPRIYSKDLIEILFEQPYCKIDFLVDNLKIERKAASRYLQSLEDTGIVTAQKIGRENIYINTRLFELLKGNNMSRDGTHI
ncbi:MAG TPA: Fic/DOC family N-terminal domain-containing protein [Bacteroidales bacterium]|nr:Fic/DOC family N-terminal domain-containing protein [Bacteroidales bacterium]HNS47014.1 Fic/DOC family N-terminal domain-containing protein [Bacteroidales bacterium]